MSNRSVFHKAVLQMEKTFNFLIRFPHTKKRKGRSIISALETCKFFLNIRGGSHSRMSLSYMSISKIHLYSYPKKNHLPLLEWYSFNNVICVF